MPRQTFLTRETFLESSENKIKELLLSLPNYCDNITYKSENQLTGILLFEFTSAGKKPTYFVSVSILPLNDQYTRVNFHASQADHAAFYENPDMAVALQQIVGSIQALVEGRFSYFNEPPKKAARTKTGIGTSLHSFISPLFLKKKYT
jgi:hypothetical protein